MRPYVGGYGAGVVSREQKGCKNRWKYGWKRDGRGNIRWVVTLGFGCSCSISVTPKTLAALSQVFHFTQLRFKTGLKGCARSMPTSAALDLVAKKILIINYVLRNTIFILFFKELGRNSKIPLGNGRGWWVDDSLCKKWLSGRTSRALKCQLVGNSLAIWWTVAPVIFLERSSVELMNSSQFPCFPRRQVIGYRSSRDTGYML